MTCDSAKSMSSHTDADRGGTRVMQALFHGTEKFSGSFTISSAFHPLARQVQSKPHPCVYSLMASSNSGLSSRSIWQTHEITGSSRAGHLSPLPACLVTRFLTHVSTFNASSHLGCVRLPTLRSSGEHDVDPTLKSRKWIIMALSRGSNHFWKEDAETFSLRHLRTFQSGESKRRTSEFV